MKIPESYLTEAEIGVLHFNGNRAVRYLNRKAEQLLGCKQDDVKNSLQTTAPQIYKNILSCFDGGLHSSIFTTQIKNRTLEVQISFIHDTTPVEAVCFIRDLERVTKESWKLAPIQEMRLQFQALMEHSGYGIYILDGQGTILNVNEVAADLIGLKQSDMLGRDVQKLVDMGAIEEPLTPRILQTRKPLTRPLWAVKNNKYIMASGVPILDAKGEVNFVVVIEHDMTIVKELRTQLHEAQQVADTIRDELSDRNLLEMKESEIIADGPAMKQVLSILLKLTKLDVSNILITGESGAGKGFLSKFIHKNGLRKNRPFISINCATLPEMLLEAELFGYEKGAFTGASESGKAGLFELANRGTIFLDEIGDLPYPIQAKLLKVLDDGEIRRLGGTKSIKVDCIVIAATNLNLEELVQKKKFRQDLYFRLNTFPVRVPPLRERQEDILAISTFFLNKFNKTYNQKKRFSEECIEELLTYDFPGNIRELENLVKNAVVIKEKNLLHGILPAKRITTQPPINQTQAQQENPPAPQTPDPRGLQDDLLNFEREKLKQAMAGFNNTRELAQFLQISQSSAARKLRKHGLSFR